MKFDPQKHRRRSIRLRDYDYSQAGVYYVTINVQNRDLLFGEIVNYEMVSNEAGKMVDEQWNALLERFPNIELDVYQIMPNHCHGIIVIVEPVRVTFAVSHRRARGTNGVVARTWTQKIFMKMGHGQAQSLRRILLWAKSSARSNPLRQTNTSKAWTIRIGPNSTNASGKEIIMSISSAMKRI